MKTVARSLWLLAICIGTAVAPVQAGELLSPEKPVHEAIGHYVRQKWAEGNVQPAATAGDSVIVRRLTLDLAGRVPTAAEARAYVESNDPQKRQKLVDRLLAGPDFAYHQRNWLDETLMADHRADGKWRDWLLKAAEENRPWDEMFREMLAGRDSKSEPKPALEFLRVRAKSLDDMTNDTSRLFFGVNVSCAKCHDHPLVLDWIQDHFYGFASFFDRTYLTKKKTLAEKPFGEVRFKTTFGEERQAKFMFLTGTVVPEPDVERTKEQIKKLEQEVRRQMKEDNAPNPQPPEFSPRERLVELALEAEENRYFSRSIVNRVWARLMGRGIVDPLDQMHSETKASHPDLLDWLARDLVTHGYDLKRLIRGIALSDAYALSSRWEGEGDPPAAEYFAVALPRPLTPRQYSLSLLIATASPEQYPLDLPDEKWDETRRNLEDAANGFAGELESPGDPGSSFQISVDEALLFSNNERIERDYLRDSGDRLVGHLKTLDDPRGQIEAAFWSTLSRRPAPAELQALEAYIAERSDRPVEAMQQVVWALITSPEMRFSH